VAKAEAGRETPFFRRVGGKPPHSREPDLVVPAFELFRTQARQLGESSSSEKNFFSEESDFRFRDGAAFSIDGNQASYNRFQSLLPPWERRIFPSSKWMSLGHQGVFAT
jgi:hypothetical protein